MSTELTILLALTAFILVGAFTGENSVLRSTFFESGPNLGARIERQLDTGAGFQEKANQSFRPLVWTGGRGDFAE